MTTHKTHTERQISIPLPCTKDQPVAQTSTWQQNTIETDRHPKDYSVKLISPAQSTLPDNTQQAQQTDIHTTPLHKGSARRTDLFPTTHISQNRQTFKGLLCTNDQQDAVTYTWQHTTLKTESHQCESSVHGISLSHRPLPDNTHQSKLTDIQRTPQYKWSARRSDVKATTHNNHKRQISIRLLCTSDQTVAPTSNRQHTKDKKDRHT